MLTVAQQHRAILAQAAASELLLCALWQEGFRDDAIETAFDGQPADVCDAAEALIARLSETGRTPESLGQAVLSALEPTSH